MPTGTKAPPLNGWMRLAIEYTYATVSTMENIWWLRFNATEAEAADNGDLTAVAAAVANAWLVRIGPSMYTGCELVGVRTMLKRASGEIASEHVFADGGSLAGSVISANAAVVVNWSTNSYYRGGKPKSFLPPPPQGKLGTTTHWGVDYVSSLTTALGHLIDDLQAITTTHLTTTPGFIAPSFVSGGAYRTVPIERHIVGAWVQQRVCTQRRRLGRPTD